jgi:hypothetical protein
MIFIPAGKMSARQWRLSAIWKKIFSPLAEHFNIPLVVDPENSFAAIIKMTICPDLSLT